MTVLLKEMYSIRAQINLSKVDLAHMRVVEIDLALCIERATNTGGGGVEKI